MIAKPEALPKFNCSVYEDQKLELFASHNRKEKACDEMQKVAYKLTHSNSNHSYGKSFKVCHQPCIKTENVTAAIQPTHTA